MGRSALAAVRELAMAKRPFSVVQGEKRDGVRIGGNALQVWIRKKLREILADIEAAPPPDRPPPASGGSRARISLSAHEDTADTDVAGKRAS